VATYGPGGRFTMTDRGEAALRQSPDRLTVGPSSLTWHGDRLEIDVDEVSSLPLVSRVRGRITVTPSAVTSVELPLLPDGSHVWRPFAPASRIEVDLGPGWQWSGHGYFDANFGTRALEADFSYWTWGRYPLADGAACFYDATRRDGSHLAAGIRFTETAGPRRWTCRRSPPSPAPAGPSGARRGPTRATAPARCSRCSTRRSTPAPRSAPGSTARNRWASTRRSTSTASPRRSQAHARRARSRAGPTGSSRD
jgi:hypothetical protein